MISNTDLFDNIDSATNEEVEALLTCFVMPESYQIESHKEKNCTFSQMEVIKNLYLSQRTRFRAIKKSIQAIADGVRVGHAGQLVAAEAQMAILSLTKSHGDQESEHLDDLHYEALYQDIKDLTSYALARFQDLAAKTKSSPGARTSLQADAQRPPEPLGLDSRTAIDRKNAIGWLLDLLGALVSTTASLDLSAVEHDFNSILNEILEHVIGCTWTASSTLPMLVFVGDVLKQLTLEMHEHAQDRIMELSSEIEADDYPGIMKHCLAFAEISEVGGFGWADVLVALYQKSPAAGMDTCELVLEQAIPQHPKAWLLLLEGLFEIPQEELCWVHFNIALLLDRGLVQGLPGLLMMPVVLSKRRGDQRRERESRLQAFFLKVVESAALFPSNARLGGSSQCPAPSPTQQLLWQSLTLNGQVGSGALLRRRPPLDGNRAATALTAGLSSGGRSSSSSAGRADRLLALADRWLEADSASSGPPKEKKTFEALAYNTLVVVFKEVPSARGRVTREALSSIFDNTQCHRRRRGLVHLLSGIIVSDVTLFTPLSSIFKDTLTNLTFLGIDLGEHYLRLVLCPIAATSNELHSALAAFCRKCLGQSQHVGRMLAISGLVGLLCTDHKAGQQRLEDAGVLVGWTLGLGVAERIQFYVCLRERIQQRRKGLPSQLLPQVMTEVTRVLYERASCFFKVLCPTPHTSRKERFENVQLGVLKLFEEIHTPFRVCVTCRDDVPSLLSALWLMYPLHSQYQQFYPSALCCLQDLILKGLEPALDRLQSLSNLVDRCTLAVMVGPLIGVVNFLKSGGRVQELGNQQQAALLDTALLPAEGLGRTNATSSNIKDFPECDPKLITLGIRMCLVSAFADVLLNNLLVRQHWSRPKFQHTHGRKVLEESTSREVFEACLEVSRVRRVAHRAVKLSKSQPVDVASLFQQAPDVGNAQATGLSFDTCCCFLRLVLENERTSTRWQKRIAYVHLYHTLEVAVRTIRVKIQQYQAEGQQQILENRDYDLVDLLSLLLSLYAWGRVFFLKPMEKEDLWMANANPKEPSFSDAFCASLAARNLDAWETVNECAVDQTDTDTEDDEELLAETEAEWLAVMAELVEAVRSICQAMWPKGPQAKAMLKLTFLSHLPLPTALADRGWRGKELPVNSSKKQRKRISPSLVNETEETSEKDLIAATNSPPVSKSIAPDGEAYGDEKLWQNVYRDGGFWRGAMVFAEDLHSGLRDGLSSKLVQALLDLLDSMGTVPEEIPSGPDEECKALLGGILYAILCEIKIEQLSLFTKILKLSFLVSSKPLCIELAECSLKTCHKAIILWLQSDFSSWKQISQNSTQTDSTTGSQLLFANEKCCYSALVGALGCLDLFLADCSNRPLDCLVSKEVLEKVVGALQIVATTKPVPKSPENSETTKQGKKSESRTCEETFFAQLLTEQAQLKLLSVLERVIKLTRTSTLKMASNIEGGVLHQHLFSKASESKGAPYFCSTPQPNLECLVMITVLPVVPSLSNFVHSWLKTETASTSLVSNKLLQLQIKIDACQAEVDKLGKASQQLQEEDFEEKDEELVESVVRSLQAWEREQESLRQTKARQKAKRKASAKNEGKGGNRLLEVAIFKRGKYSEKKRILRSRNKIIDEWLQEDEESLDAFVDLEDFIEPG